MYTCLCVCPPCVKRLERPQKGIGDPGTRAASKERDVSAGNSTASPAVETPVPLGPACCMSFCTVGCESYARCHWWWHWGLSVSMRVNDTESQVNLREMMHFEGLRWLGYLGIHLFKFLCRSLTFALFLGYLIFTVSKLHASQYKLCIKNSANFRWTLPTLRTLILK